MKKKIDFREKKIAYGNYYINSEFGSKNTSINFSLKVFYESSLVHKTFAQSRNKIHIFASN